MGKSKSVPDLATKPVVTWTSEDVKHWLKEHESLNKYAKQLKVGHRTVTMQDCASFMYLLQLNARIQTKKTAGCLCSSWFLSSGKYGVAAGNNRQGASEAD